MQSVVVWNVVHEEQKTVGTSLQRLVNLRQLGRILANIPSARTNGAVHADALAVSAEPLPPAVSLRGFDAGTVMDAENIGKCPNAQRTRVQLIHSPGVCLQSVDDENDLWIVAKSKPGPGVDNLGSG